MRDEWGCELFSLEEELNLPEEVKEARKLKTTIVSRCKGTINLLNDAKRRARQAPEKGEEWHLKLLRELLADVEAAHDAAQKAFMVGRHVKGE